MAQPTNWQNGDIITAIYLNSLGADVNAAYVKPGTGIPSSDMSSAVVTSLGKADTALQSLDADLNAIAALTPSNDDLIQRKAGVWTNRTIAQVKSDLGIAADIAAAQLVTISAQTDNYTLVLGDAYKAVEVAKATAVNVTVPPNSSVAYPIGTVIEVVQTGAGQVTVVAGSGVTIDYPSTLKTRAQWSTVALRKRATNTWILSGDAA